MRTNHIQRRTSLFQHCALAAAVLAFVLAAAAGPARAQCVTPPHAGTWVNINSGTDGITRAVIEFNCVDVVVSGQPVPSSWHVTIWGKCRPSDCRWGRVVGTESGSASAIVITARYNPSYGRRTVTIRHVAATNRLTIRVATNFTDPGRRDYTATDTMRPAP